MNLIILVRSGKYLNYTLSSIKFDSLGKYINNNIEICDKWVDGINSILNKNWSHLLMVDSGTIFKDWLDWENIIKKYPVKDLVGHLIWYPNTHFPELNYQCTLVSKENIDIFLNREKVNCPIPIRSKLNLHDDYTPYFINGDKVKKIEASGPLANALLKNIHIANWNNTARDKKFFLYNDSDKDRFIESQQEYIKLAENQLWVLNNEPVYILKGKKVLTVGSGLFWIMNIIQNNIESLDVVDISNSQVKLCNELWSTWDGNNYGNFVYDFIKTNKIINFQMDNPKFTKIDFINFRKKDTFVNYVNEKFNECCDNLKIHNFAELWNSSKSKKFSCKLDNIVNVETKTFDDVWFSNAKDYKWTFLHE